MKKLYLAAALLLAAIATSANAEQVITSSNVTYSARSVEAKSVFQWLADRYKSSDVWNLADVKAGLASGGTVEVTTTNVSASGLVVATSASSPPTPLPTSGTPGQTITIIVTYPGGGTTVWTYQWVSSGTVGGDWVLTDYEDHHPVTTGPHQ